MSEVASFDTKLCNIYFNVKPYVLFEHSEEDLVYVSCKKNYIPLNKFISRNILE